MRKWSASKNQGENNATKQPPCPLAAAPGFLCGQGSGGGIAVESDLKR